MDCARNSIGKRLEGHRSRPRCGGACEHGQSCRRPGECHTKRTLGRRRRLVESLHDVLQNDAWRGDEYLELPISSTGELVADSDGLRSRLIKRAPSVRLTFGHRIR